MLAVDSSGSISEQRLAMQIHGYIDALRHPAFIEAMRGGRRGRIGLTYVTWTDARRQDQVVPWRVIADQADAFAFAQAMQDALRPLPGWTSISGAIDFCTGLLLSSGYIATRRVIDISGDGANNDGRPVTEARDAAVAAGVTINGLPIIEVEPNLEQYYRDNVIGGADSFVVVATRQRRLRRGRPAQVAGRGRRHSSRPSRAEQGIHGYPSSAARTAAASSCRRYGLRSMAPAVDPTGSAPGSDRK